MQKTFHVIDPGIPGIEVITPSSPEFAKIDEAKYLGKFGFLLKNKSSHTIIGAVISFRIDGRPNKTVIDGISPAMDVRPGTYILAAPGIMLQSEHTAAGVNAGGSFGAPESASVDFLLFDDGNAYGQAKWFDLVQRKRAFKVKFMQELQKDPEAYLAKMAECLDKGCDEVPQADRDFLWDAIEDFRGPNQVMGVKALEFARIHQSLLSRFPKALRFMGRRDVADDLKAGPTGREVAALTPKDHQDGWFISNIAMNCGNGSPAYISRTPGGGCTFPLGPNFTPNPPEQDIPITQLIDTSINGFIATANGTCILRPPGEPIIGFPTNVRDGFWAARIVAGDPLQAAYAPRNKIYSNFRTNEALNGSGWADALYSALLVTIPESHNPNANNDGGSTNCAVLWSSNISPFLPLRQDWLWSSYSDGGAPVYSSPTLNADGTLGSPAKTMAWPFPMGYVVTNRKSITYCSPDEGPSFSIFTAIKERPVYGNNATESTSCTHIPPSTAGNPQCNPWIDWCCCMATYNDWFQCTALGLTPDDLNCPTPGDAYNVVHAQGQTVSYNGATATVDPAAATPGIFRNNGSSGGALIIDDAHSYDVSTSTISSLFAIPGGVQATDKAVSGDWAGIHKSAIGIYRPSTGHWYLDANYNGVWDGTSGGDMDIQFGGDPSDVPVVGDWQGGGRHCVGVFRYGYLWVLDANCNGRWDGIYYGGDNQFAFGGAPGDLPIVGYWSGAVQAQVGVVRCYIPAGGSSCASPNFLWIIDFAAANDIDQYDHGVGQGMNTCGLPQDQAVYNSRCKTPAPFAYGGVAGDVFVPADWSGTGVSRAAVYRSSSGQWIVDIDGEQSSNPFVFSYGGLSTDTPIPGKW